MPSFALPLPPLPSLPSFGSLHALPSLNSLSNLIDPGPSVFYPATKSKHFPPGEGGSIREATGTDGNKAIQVKEGGQRHRAGSWGRSDGQRGDAALREAERRGRTTSTPQRQGDRWAATRRSRAGSVSSTRSSIALPQGPNNQALGEEWKVVDNPLVRARRGSGSSAVSSFSTSGSSSALDVNIGMDEDTTPRPARHPVYTQNTTVGQYTPPRHLQIEQSPSRGSATRMRPLHRRAISALATPTSTSPAAHGPSLIVSIPDGTRLPTRPPPRRANSGSGYNGTANGFAFPAPPPHLHSSSKLYDITRNLSAVSLPTLEEGDHSPNLDSDHTFQPRRYDGKGEERTRRGSLSIALPKCHTRTYSTSSNASVSGGSPGRANPNPNPLGVAQGLYRAMSNSSAGSDWEGRRPTSPLSVCSTLSSSMDSEILDLRMGMCRSGEDRGAGSGGKRNPSFSVPPPLPHAAQTAQGQSHQKEFPMSAADGARPCISPRAYSTNDIKSRQQHDPCNNTRRSRTYSNVSVQSGELVFGKSAVEAPSTSEVAVIATWSFTDSQTVPNNCRSNIAANGGDAGGMVPSMTLKERLAGLSRINTGVSSGGLEVDSLDGEGEERDEESPTPGKSWRMPLKVASQSRDTTVRATSKNRPLIRVTSLADEHHRRPAHLTHRHTHSSPTLLHPAYTSLHRITPTDGRREDQRPACRKRQLSRLREPAPLGAPRSIVGQQAIAAKAPAMPLRRSSVDEIRGRPSQSTGSALQGGESGAEEPKAKKSRWWARRSSISGPIPQALVQDPRTVIRSHEDRDGDVDLATASLSSLDLAETAAGGKRTVREESPESEDFIDFDDM